MILPAENSEIRSCLQRASHFVCERMPLSSKASEANAAIPPLSVIGGGFWRGPVRMKRMVCGWRSTIDLDGHDPPPIARRLRARHWRLRGRAPSVHPSGFVYRIAKDRPIAEAPPWLVDVVVPDERPEPLPEPCRMSLWAGRAPNS